MPYNSVSMSAQVHTSPAMPPRPLQWSWWLLASVLLTVLQVHWAGYELGVGNQSIQVPFLLHLHDSALFARDQMVQLTLDQYPSLFYRVLAKFIPVVPVPWLYLWLHLLTTAGVFFAVIALCSAMFKDRWVGLIAGAMLLAGHHQALAEQTMYSTGFTHTWAVFPFVIGALALLYADRPFAAFALAGVIFNLHALDAAQLAAAMLFWAVCSLHWRKVFYLAVIFIVFASPTVLFMLWHRQPVNDLWLPLMHVRSAQHSFPFTWWRPGEQDVPRFLAVLALAGLSLSLLPPGPATRKTLRLTGGVAILFIIGIVFTEVWPNALVIRAQLFRSSRFLMILALACMAAGCRRGWSRSLLRGHIVEFTSATLIFACLAIPPWLVLLPWVLLFATLAALFNRRLLWQQAALIGFAGLVCLAAWRTIDFVVPGLSPGFSWKALASWHRPVAGNEPDWIDAQLWARAHTPPDALFLTPAQVNGFRVHSQRSIVGEWRDGTQLYFSTAYAQPWWERMNALQPGMRLAPDGQHLLVQGRSISQLSDQQIIDLADRFEADFVVLGAETPRTLVELYRNSKWAIYRPELAPPPSVSQADALDEQQQFMKSVVLPNIEKFRKSSGRLQIIDARGRPLYDAKFRIVQTGSAFAFGAPTTNRLFNFTLVTGDELPPSPAAHGHRRTLEFSSLAGDPPVWVKHAPANDQARRLLAYATSLVDSNANQVDYWQMTDQGVWLDQLPALVSKICAKHPDLRLGISVAPRLSSPRPADERRGLDDIRQLADAGVALDFVAIQGHQPWGVWADPKVLYEIFDAFAQEGVRIHVTAFAAPSEGWIEGTVRHGQWTPELQAEYCRLFYAVCYSHPSVDVVNYLDIGPNPRVPGIGLLDDNGNPKPACRAIQDLITRRWHTETNGTVALDGLIPFRGFQGTYDLEVRPPKGELVRTSFPLEPGTNANFRFQLNAAGRLVQLP
jgi:hypothetical protein